MGLLNSLSVGGRGLGAASAAIDVTSQNVSNVNTPGYARRSVHQTTMDPIARGGLFIGQGVSVDTIHRASDRLLGARYVQATGDNAYASSLESSLRVTEGYFDEANSTGLVEAYDAYYDALGSAASDPGSASLRQGAVAAGSLLASVVSRTANGLQTTLDGVAGQLDDGLVTLNDSLQRIADFNMKIREGGGNVADLEDQRDQLVVEVAEQTGATAEFRADGTANLYLGGHAIVSDGAARSLSMQTDSSGAPQLYVSADSGKLRVTDKVGGTIGGALSGWQKTKGYLDDLDEFAYSFVTATNAQHAAGYDRSGAAGGDLFTASAAVSGSALGMSIDPTVLADSSKLALASDPSAPAGDGGNLDALRATETDTAIFGGQTGHDKLSALVVTVGHDITSAESENDSTTATLEDIKSIHDAISQVDTDEEAMNLLQYQTAYRASAKVISTVNGLLEDLIRLGD